MMKTSSILIISIISMIVSFYSFRLYPFNFHEDVIILVYIVMIMTFTIFLCLYHSKPVLIEDPSLTKFEPPTTTFAIN